MIPETRSVFDQPWWKRLTSLEPALVRAVAVAVVGVLALTGINATEWGDKLVEGWTYIFTVLPLIQGWWTRQNVIPPAKVVEVVEPDGTTTAGPASPLPTGSVVSDPRP